MTILNDSGAKAKPRNAPYLTFIGALALSFGYAVGWGAFIMPGTRFLPVAGPAGTALGILLGGFAMCLFALNFHRMVLRDPSEGGAYSHTKKMFGSDHAFLVGWFLILTYVSIMWANATASILLVRHLFGDALQFGFHYNLVGFDIWFGEAMMSTLVIVAGGVACMRGRIAARMQTILAFAFLFGLAAAFAVAFGKHEGGVASMGPAFAPGGKTPVVQTMLVLAMMPWAFIGFEAVANYASDFRFNAKKTIYLLLASICISTLLYLMLALLPVLSVPNGCHSWAEYLVAKNRPGGVSAIPVFAAASKAAGFCGVVLMAAAMTGAILTGVIGGYVATGRLIRAMAEDGTMPAVLAKSGKDGAPRNAVALVTVLSAGIPFLGRAVIAWPIDISSLGAAIAYGYVSAAAIKAQGSHGAGKVIAGKMSGWAGVAFSLFFCFLLLVPSYLSGDAMAAESYLMLAAWCIVGFVFYKRVFRLDAKGAYGTTTVVWMAIIILIFFSSLMWVRQATVNLFGNVVDSLLMHGMSEQRLVSEMDGVADAALRNATVELVLLVSTLAVMSSLYSILRRREKILAVEKAKADEVSKAKNLFFSSVSHDIRTPLNAIIGFSQMLKLGFDTDAEREEAIDSILVSGKTLQNLINDILDLSKLEAGQMPIEPEPTDCAVLVEEIVRSFRVVSKKPDLEIRSAVRDMPVLMLDPHRLRQIVFNLLGNAVKFTERGFVEVRASFRPSGDGETGAFRIAVQDTGCGISDEDQLKIASPYRQFGKRGARLKGTGLGLSICRNLAKAMGGEFSLESRLGEGSTFRVAVPSVRIADAPATNIRDNSQEGAGSGVGDRPAAVRLRALLVDDQKMNLTVLKSLLGRLGDFDISFAGNGREALDAIESASVPFDFVLTDMWMPVMDGEEFVREIRSIDAFGTLPVYVLTADVEARGNYAEMGFTGMLLKPITLERLKEVVEAVKTHCVPQ